MRRKPEFVFNWERIAALVACCIFWAFVGYGCAYTVGWVK